jgi:hypothetical protein
MSHGTFAFVMLIVAIALMSDAQEVKKHSAADT